MDSESTSRRLQQLRRHLDVPSTTLAVYQGSVKACPTSSADPSANLLDPERKVRNACVFVSVPARERVRVRACVLASLPPSQ